MVMFVDKKWPTLEKGFSDFEIIYFVKGCFRLIVLLKDNSFQFTNISQLMFYKGNLPAETMSSQLAIIYKYNYLCLVKIFHVDLWGEDNVMLNEDQILQQLQRVMDSSKQPSEESIGILTSDNRDNWAAAYNILIKGKRKVIPQICLCTKLFL